MICRVLSSLALSAILAGAVLAQAADVYCGSYTPIKFRVAAGGKEPQARADKAMEVINKYLGGKAPTVTTKPEGQNVKLMIQKDVVATATPADAKAARMKNAKAVAADWSKKLTKALKESCAQK